MHISNMHVRMYLVKVLVTGFVPILGCTVLIQSVLTFVPNRLITAGNIRLLQTYVYNYCCEPIRKKGRCGRTRNRQLVQFCLNGAIE